MIADDELRDRIYEVDRAARVQHKSFSLMERLPILKAALEELANADLQPDVRRTCREALNEINSGSVTIERPGLFAPLDPTDPVPPVDIADLKSFRELVLNLSEELDAAPIYLEEDFGKSTATVVKFGLENQIRRVCSPMADAHSLWQRNGTLEMLIREGHLSWTERNDEAVLLTAAEVPFDAQTQNVEPHVFLLHLKAEHEKRGLTPRGSHVDAEAGRYEQRRHHYRLLHLDVQQLQFEYSVLSRKMAKGRSALEAAATSNSPVAAKIARDTLESLKVQSQHDIFTSFFAGVEDGGAVPPVAAEELKRLYQYYEESNERHRAAGITGSVARGMDLISTICGPLANSLAVSHRNTLLSFLIAHGALSEWQHGTKLDDAVFKVAATIPIKGLELDTKAWIERIRAASTI